MMEKEKNPIKEKLGNSTELKIGGKEINSRKDEKDRGGFISSKIDDNNKVKTAMSQPTDHSFFSEKSEEIKKTKYSVGRKIVMATPQTTIRNSNLGIDKDMEKIHTAPIHYEEKLQSQVDLHIDSWKSKRNAGGFGVVERGLNKAVSNIDSELKSQDDMGSNTLSFAIELGQFAVQRTKDIKRIADKMDKLSLKQSKRISTHNTLSITKGNIGKNTKLNISRQKLNEIALTFPKRQNKKLNQETLELKKKLITNRIKYNPSIKIDNKKLENGIKNSNVKKERQRLKQKKYKIAKREKTKLKTGVTKKYKKGSFVKTGSKTKKISSKTSKTVKNKAKKNIAKQVQKGISVAAKESVKTATVTATAATNPISLTLIAVIAAVLVFFLIIIVVCAVAILFSPVVTDENGNEMDETAFLSGEIVTKRNSLIQEIKDTYNDNLIANGGSYHFVRFFDTESGVPVTLNDTNIATSIPAENEYLESIQPIFHTIMLSEYELTASVTQMKNILDYIWAEISTVKTEELPIEYCNMGSADNDGVIHADITSCPNYGGIQFHSSDLANPLCSCDYYYWICKGHTGDTPTCGKEEHVHTRTCINSSGTTVICGKTPHTHVAWVSVSDEGCYGTTTHTGALNYDCENADKYLVCNGYYVCNGHKVLKLYVDIKSFGDLLNTYFLNDISRLEALASRTPEEDERLSELKDNYDICLAYVEVLNSEFGRGGTVVSIEGVELTDITAYACQFVGNPYVWGGTDPNTGADCSGFVQYVYAHFGVTLNRVARDQVKQGQIVPSLAQAQAGDLIFWSDTGTDSGVTHVAMYLGNNLMVHASNPNPYPSGGIKVSDVYGPIYKIKRIVSN